MVIESFTNNVYKHLMKNFELQNAKEIFQEHAWEFYHVDGRDDHAKFDYWLLAPMEAGDKKEIKSEEDFSLLHLLMSLLVDLSWIKKISTSN